MTAKRTKSKAAPTVQDFDREFRAQIGQMTGGLAPAAFSNAWADWATHLACSPAKQLELQQHAADRVQDTLAFAMRAMTGAEMPSSEGLDGEADRRFEAKDWLKFPFNVYARAYQNNVALLKEAVDDV